jgi:hypothetical protein
VGLRGWEGCVGVPHGAAFILTEAVREAKGGPCWVGSVIVATIPYDAAEPCMGWTSAVVVYQGEGTSWLIRASGRREHPSTICAVVASDRGERHSAHGYDDGSGFGGVASISVGADWPDSRGVVLVLQVVAQFLGVAVGGGHGEGWEVDDEEGRLSHGAEGNEFRQLVLLCRR